MQMAPIDLQTDARPDLHVDQPGQSRDEGLPAGIEVHDGFVAQQLDNQDVSVAGTLVDGADPHVLGADADLDFSFVGGQGDGNSEAAGLEHPVFDAVGRPTSAAGENVHRGRTQRAGDEHIGGALIDFGGRAHLAETSLVQHGDALPHRHRLALIVRDVHHGGAEGAVQRHQLGAELHAQVGVEIRQGFVQEEYRRLTHHRAGERGALALAPRQLIGAPLEQIGDAEPRRDAGDAAVDVRLRRAAHLQGKGDVLGDGEVWVQGVVLEYHRHVAIGGRHASHDAIIDEDVARGGMLEPRDAAECRRLAASRGTEQHEQLPVQHLEREVVDGGLARCVERDGQAAQGDGRHGPGYNGGGTHPRGTGFLEDHDLQGWGDMPHTLPALPYDFAALEPHIDAQTMQIHHGKHHQAYVNNLNGALDKHPELHQKTLEDLLRNINTIPEDIRTVVRNNGGGHHNHSLFWTIMAPAGKGGGGEPSGKLADAVTKALGGFAKLKEQLTAAATGRFGSGWAWLVAAGGKVEVLSTANQDSPVMDGKTPLLGLDVWEHAYYLKYQNRRPDYVAAWWNVVNWSEVGRRLAEAH